MPTVAELSDPYANFMLGPRHGPDVCAQCFNLTDGFSRCYACVHGGRFLDAMVPISYSVAGEQMHHALAGYKRLHGASARRLTLGLAAVLWRHLALHESCVKRAANVETFTLVTIVPSGIPERDAAHPLHELVSLVAPLQDRYERVLRRSDTPAAPHEFQADKYELVCDVNGRSVLLIDDTWTKGANAQSAAAALKAAGATTVAAVVIGRHVNRGWHHNDRHLRMLPQPYDWSRCALCAQEAEKGGDATR
ncbi:MAG TPA: hypothetical protein VE127_05860 [Solirubrobacteraceae bacterium]|nr:hypothetical protein [Solirubrobacteraceae bacterium]